MPYNEDLKHKWDWKNAIDYAYEEAKKEGYEKAVKKVACRLKKEKMPAEKMARITGLSVGDIEVL